MTGQAKRAPNVLVLITDQQRSPRHWPDDSGWLRDLTPNDHELARTGVSFSNGYCNTAMCSPSRATLLTGRYPAQHGVKLTLTAADLRPDKRNGPWVAMAMADILRRREAPTRRVISGFLRGATGIGPSAGGEPELPATVPNLARLLEAHGYTVSYKGKWHLTHPSGDASDADDLLGGWRAEDGERIEVELGFRDWAPPDAGENAKARHFGGGNAASSEGWDEEYTRQVESWLGQSELPEPFCLIVSLVNPHDVLGYPAAYVEGGYSSEEWSDLEVGLPPTIDEDLSGKPSVHALMRMGMAAYLGPLRTRQAKLDYVNFYAHLHRVIDAKIGRVLGALGDPGDPASLRSRTIVVRCSDHGEMGLSHGGLRQKAFNFYEETVNVPIVVSNPILFPEPAETPALASLIDLLPTIATLTGASSPGGVRGIDLTPVLAGHAAPGREPLSRASVDLSAVTETAPAASVQDAIHFTYDDHQAGTAMQNAPGQPNRIRAIRNGRWKYARYFDPQGKAPTEYEMYDLERDPDEAENLLALRTGEAKRAGDRRARHESVERLERGPRRVRNARGSLSGARIGFRS